MVAGWVRNKALEYVAATKVLSDAALPEILSICLLFLRLRPSIAFPSGISWNTGPLAARKHQSTYYGVALRRISAP